MKALLLTSLTALTLQAQSPTPPVEPTSVPAQDSAPAEMLTLTAPGKGEVSLESTPQTNKDLAMAGFKKCYDQTVAEATAQNQPIPTGKVVVDFSFDSEGTVTQFEFKENRVRPASTALNDCIETSIRQTKFEKLQSQRNGKVVNLFYPYIFENKKRVKR